MGNTSHGDAMKKFSLGLALGLLLVWQGSGFAAAAKNGCLTCHTNDAMMKSLYKPPAMQAGEGEG
jgi:hypothetical protein